MRPGGEGGNTKEESGLFGTRKESTGGNARIVGSPNTRAGENIGPRFAIQYTCTCARDVTRVWHVFLGLQSCRFHASIHVHTCTYTRAPTHTHTPPICTYTRTRVHIHTCHPHVPTRATPTHRLHTYVGTVHIKLGGRALSFAAAQE